MPVKINVKDSSNQDVYFQSKYPDWTYFGYSGVTTSNMLYLPSYGWTELRIRVRVSNRPEYTAIIPRAFLNGRREGTCYHVVGSGSVDNYWGGGMKIMITTFNEYINLFSSTDGNYGSDNAVTTYIYVYLR